MKLNQFYQTYKVDRKKVNGVFINFRMGGSGPALLLIHGYPQSHTIWYKIADGLAKYFTIVMPDLRGYGDSECPKTDTNHLPYSKRETGKDLVELMNTLGFRTFNIVGHDRGGRVAHRLTLDHPNIVNKLCVLDIAPTYMMYNTTDRQFAQSYFHWFFLTQPFNIPETLIGSNKEYFIKLVFRSKPNMENAFPDEVINEYIRCFTDETVHGSCEDYRASATIDMEHDKESLGQGLKLTCPVLAIWGDQGLVGNKYDVVKEWKVWADEVSGKGLDCGHFIPEEAPKELLQVLLPFFQS